MRQYTYYIWDERPGMQICSQQIEDALAQAGLQFEFVTAEVI